jgi:hypothetical protein
LVADAVQLVDELVTNAVERAGRRTGSAHPVRRFLIRDDLGLPRVRLTPDL